jgi:hypothetical protein
MIKVGLRPGEVIRKNCLMTLQNNLTTIKLWLPRIQDEYETLHTDIEEW